MAFNILAIDGGGIRGLIPAVVLSELERRAQAPVASLFGLLAGTSTGGILAAALTVPDDSGAHRHRAEQLVELYAEHGPRIFRRSLARRLRSAFGALEEKYDHAALEQVLQRYLGDVRVSRAIRPLLLTAYELETRTPYFVKSWRAVSEPDRDLLMREAAPATSAAPQLLGPERYHRFQPTLGPARDDFDDVSARNLEMLTEQARELVARRSGDLDRLLEQLVG